MSSNGRDEQGDYKGDDAVDVSGGGRGRGPGTGLVSAEGRTEGAVQAAER